MNYSDSKYEDNLKLVIEHLENQIKELKEDRNSIVERLEIAEKHIAMSGEVIWDSYIEEVRTY